MAMSADTLDPATLAMLDAYQGAGPQYIATPSAADFAQLQGPSALQSFPADPIQGQTVPPPAAPAAAPTQADLSQMQNPATMGAAPAQGTPVPAAPTQASQANPPAADPSQDPNQNPEAALANAKAMPGFKQWAESSLGWKKGDQIPLDHLNKIQEIYAEATLKAKQTPSPQFINANGHQYMLYGNNTPINVDKPPAFHQAQLADGTLGQVDAATGKFTAFTDGAGNPIKGKLGGSADTMNAVAAMANNAQIQTLQSQAADLVSKIASGQSTAPHFWQDQTPYAQQLAGIQAKLGALQGTPPVAAGNGASDAAIPVAAPSLTASGPAVVTGPDDYAKIPAGAPFVFNGKVLTKRGQ